MGFLVVMSLAKCTLIGPLLSMMLWACPAESQVSPLPANQFMASPSGSTGNLAPRALVSSDLYQGSSCPVGQIFFNNSGSIGCTAAATGTTTNTTWTGGIVSIATPTTTPAFTIAGTSGGIPYFSGSATWASSGALAANQIILGGGAGVAPSTPVGLGTTTTLLHGNAAGAPTFGAIVSADVSTVLASPPCVGCTAANTGAFTTLSSSVADNAGGTLTVTGLSTMNGALNVNGSSGTQSTLTATNTGTATSQTTPGFNFLESEGYASYASNTTHFGWVEQATKNVVGSNTTGSRQGGTMQQLGAGGGSSDFFTGGFQLAFPCGPTVVCNSFNLGGNFTGNNPYVNIPTGLAVQSAVGEEVDATVMSTSTVVFREGVRIVDVGSNVNGSTLDAAINVASSGNGWKSLIHAGDTTGTFGLAAGGTFIDSPATTVALASLMNFNAITGVPTLGGIVLGPNVGQNICWGLTSSCLGGQISSQTVAGGGVMIFINGFTGFQFSGTTNNYIGPSFYFHVPVTFATLPACAAGTKGYESEISDQTAALGFNTAANGGGAISAAVRCDGTSWKDY